MRKQTICLFAACFCCVFVTLSPSVQAQQAPDFYKGKTLTIIVGYAVGGGFDEYARLLADFLPRYIPGHPTAIVQNMPGASSLVATHHILGPAPRDGTVIGIPNQNMFLDQILGRDYIDFDMTKLNWLGRLGTRLSVGVVLAKSGVKTLEDATKQEITLAGTGSSGGTDFLPTVLNKLLGTRFRVVKGYSGQTDMYLSVERGETHGMASAVWQDLKTGAQASWRQKGVVNLLYVVAAQRTLDLPDVPTLPELGKTPDQKAVLDIMVAADTIGRSFYVAPQVPPDRVAILRSAFAQMVKDPDMLREAQTRNVEINPLSGEDLKKFLDGVIATPKPVVDQLRTLIGAS
jgi:tripartite-type tricarboxylate transporter receptor subunit TctC